MELNKLFLHTLGQLEYLATKGDDYSLIRASALLRQLLLDDYPLADQVNRTHKLKILFPVRFRKEMERAEKENPTAEFLGLGFQRGWPPPPPDQIEHLSRDSFLNNRAYKVKGVRLTNRDVINHVANVMGGVHRGTDKDVRHKLLSGIVQSTAISSAASEIPFNLSLLQGLCWDVLDAMAPLAQAVRASQR